LYHLGIRGHLSRSTLADANETRDWRIFADLARVLIATARPLYAGDPLGVELEETAYALDCTTIDLCLSLFPWARYRRLNAAIKMHTLLDLRGSIPVGIDIKPAKIHEIRVFDQLLPEPGAFYLLDRGYLDFARLYNVLNEQGEKVPHDFPILPSTKVATLLDRYPELEDVLIGLAPPFKKLKNPLLRKGVAKVASLKHAAAVGGISVSDLVNTLRAAVGQEAIAFGDAGGSTFYFSGQPEWFAAANIVSSIDERAADPNKMPIVTVLQRATALQTWRNVRVGYNLPSCSGNRDHETKGSPSMVSPAGTEINPDIRFEASVLKDIGLQAVTPEKRNSQETCFSGISDFNILRATKYK
jgi:Domain of unknown function (DUF1858)/Transposase DDE domain